MGGYGRPQPLAFDLAACRPTYLDDRFRAQRTMAIHDRASWYVSACRAWGVRWPDSASQSDRARNRRRDLRVHNYAARNCRRRVSGSGSMVGADVSWRARRTLGSSSSMADFKPTEAASKTRFEISSQRIAWVAVRAPNGLRRRMLGQAGASAVRRRAENLQCHRLASGI